MTECIPAQAVLAFPGQVPVVVRSDAPEMSSDAGWLLLRGIDEQLGLVRELAAVLPDEREASRVVHSREEQLRQRVYQIALGYSDCNDADSLRRDPLLKTVCGRQPDDPEGLSSQPTLSRFENGVSGPTVGRVVRSLERQYVASLSPDSALVILDLDSTDDRTYGQQQLTMFNGYFDHRVYHPLLVFDGETGQIVTAVLRAGKSHANRGARGVLRRLILAIRRRCPHAQIVVRGDSAFSSPRIVRELERLEEQMGEVFYLLGFAKNEALVRLIAPTMARAREQYEIWNTKAVRFTSFRYRAQTWKLSRLIVAKADFSAQGPNPRFVLTNITGFDADMLYRAYCERGQCENRIKDFKNALAADRLSCSSFCANFFRLLLHLVAYRLMQALRQAIAPLSQELGRAQFDTLRLKLLKVGALVTQSVRRILVRLPQAFPLQKVFLNTAQAFSTPPALT